VLSLKNPLAIIGLLAAMAFVIAQVNTDSSPDPDVWEGNVTRVVDGDSLYLEGRETQIRLFGVDAPERQEDGYQLATDTLFSMAFGKSLICAQVDEDKYGRFIGRCFLEDGREINQAMINSGTTREYCRFSKGIYNGC
jgi:endonuclease YncB( thermonuclease family)